MAKSYKEKLRHPKWQKRRFEIFTRDNWTCRGCKNTEVELHVHHKVYYPGRDPWDYNDDELISYCAKCHNWEHGIIPFKDNSDHNYRENIYIKPLNKIPTIQEIKDHLLKKDKK